jgi:hypothetical protein
MALCQPLHRPWARHNHKIRESWMKRLTSIMDFAETPRSVCDLQ